MAFDIKTEGKGIWYVVHTLALHATTEKTKESFQITIHTLCEHFGCETCKVHFKKFIDDNPLKNQNYFKWTWELHNSVNRKLNKPILSLEDALAIYKNYVCKDCDEPKQILVPIPTTFKLSLISR